MKRVKMLNKENWIRLGASLGVVALVLGGIGAYSASVQRFYKIDQAFVDKDTSKALGSAENPYTILEVVPDTNMAQIGYLIDGCEPQSLDSIADNDTARGLYKTTFGTVATADGNESVATVYEPTSSDPETLCLAGEKPTRATSATTYSDSATGKGYSEYGYYTKDDDGIYTYNKTKKCFCKKTDPSTSSDTKVGSFSWNCIGYFYEVTAGTGDYTRETTATRYTDDLGNMDKAQVSYVSSMGSGNYKFQNTSGEAEHDFTLILDVNAENDKIVPEISQTGLLKGDSRITIDDAVKSGQRIYYIRTEAQYYGYKLNSITNNNVYLKNVLGVSDVKGYVTQVVVVTPEQLKNNTKATNLIKKSDAIIFHDMEAGYNIYKELDASVTNASFNTSNLDIDDNVLKLLIERQASGVVTDTNGNVTNKPAMMIFDESAVASTTRIKKLYNILNTQGAKYYYNDSQNTNRLNGKISSWKALTDPTNFATTGDVVGVSQFVYSFNDDHNFTTEFGDKAAITKGASNETAFTMLGTSDTTMSTANMLKATNAESLGGLQPKKMKVLELQAIAKYEAGTATGWLEKYMKMFPWFVGSSASGDIMDDLEITTMPTYEFVGKVEDLNNKYDIIYIGKEQDNSNGASGYNDTSLNNQIYTAVGDKISTTTDKTFGEKITAENNIRYAATDITKKKYDELRDFAKSKNIVFANDLYTTGTTNISSTEIDTSAFIYRLGNLAKDSSYNVYKYKTVADSNGKAISKNVSKTGCSFEFTENIYQKDSGKPKEYVPSSSGINSSSYNTQKDNGQNVMEYYITVSGDANKQYEVSLFTDTDGNGIFEGSAQHLIERADNDDTSAFSSEKNANITIYDISEGTRILDGYLVSGHTYRIIKRVNTSEKGLIPWKLEINEKNNLSIRYAETGYTRINSNKKEQINVLQMNLSPNMQTDPEQNVNFKDNQYFKDYTKDLDDYTINMTYMTNAEWYKKYAKGKEDDATKLKAAQEAWTNDLLNDYNMLILGYRDMACFTSDPVFIAGFEAFRESGKAIIMSHDMVEDESINSDVSKDVSYYLRRISGQMKKYYNTTAWSSTSNALPYTYITAYSNGNELSFAPPSQAQNSIYDYYFAKYTTGKHDTDMKFLDEPLMANYIGDNSVRCCMRYGFRSSKMDRIYSNISLTITKDAKGDEVFDLKWLGNAKTQKVIEANTGQITIYPYKMNKTVDVATTHVQNFQTDLEYDKDGDVMVWYNLGYSGSGKSGEMYGLKENDSRNNYYIYTKGNVTYTGLGHTRASDGTTITANEVKLFINTMIAAYRSASADPYIDVLDDNASKNSNTTTIYIEERDAYEDNGCTCETRCSSTANATCVACNESKSNCTANAFEFRLVDDTVNPRIKKDYTISVQKKINGEAKGAPVVYTCDSDTYKNSGFTKAIKYNYKDVKSGGTINNVDYEITVKAPYTMLGSSRVFDDNKEYKYTIHLALLSMFDLY